MEGAVRHPRHPTAPSDALASLLRGKNGVRSGRSHLPIAATHSSHLRQAPDAAQYGYVSQTVCYTVAIAMSQ